MSRAWERPLTPLTLLLLSVLVVPLSEASVGVLGDSEREGQPGKPVQFHLELSNERGDDRRFYVEVTDQDWKTLPKKYDGVHVPGRGNASVMIAITPPENATAGASGSSTIEVSSCLATPVQNSGCFVEPTDEGSVTLTVRIPEEPAPVEESGSTGDDPSPQGTGPGIEEAAEDPFEAGAAEAEHATAPSLFPRWSLFLLPLLAAAAAGTWWIRRHAGRHAATSDPRKRYAPVRTLGRGAFGTAVLARDRLLKRDVVLKTLRLPDPEPALREARAASAIRHPNLLQVFDAFEHREGWTLVLEHAEGGSLQSRLESGPLPPRESVRVVLDVLAGLAAVHAAGILHRDLKPANVLLTREGDVKIADFGLAAAQRAEATLATSAGATLPAGTLLYLAPEVLAGRPHTKQSDAYAVGALLHQALTGRWHLGEVPRDPVAAAEALRSREVALPLQGVSRELNVVLARALARDPAHRFRDAPQFRAALTATPEAANPAFL